MEVLIVGHGPGLIGAGRGKEVDAHEVVVRFGDSGYWQKEADYGCKTDYILSGYHVIADLINVGIVPKQTWVYGREGWIDAETVAGRIGQYNPVICTETFSWAKRFKELGAKGYCSKRCPDPHFSQGMAAIIVAAHRLDAKTIRLVGFQALLTGNRDNYDSGMNKGQIFTAKHDFAAEKNLLDEVQRHYGFDIAVGLGNEK